MSFGSKRLDDAYDRWATQSPDEYYAGDEEFEDIEGELAEEKDLKKEKKIRMHEKQKCISCGFLFWRKHKCRKEKNEKK